MANRRLAGTTPASRVVGADELDAFVRDIARAGHVAFDRKQNQPLANLFVRMLQQVGLPEEKFGASTGVISELGTPA